MPPRDSDSPPANSSAIELRGLVKDFAIGLRGTKLRALDRLDLRIEGGEIFGLLGPNGSGKSTTIKIILGLIEPTQGTSAIFGVPSCRVDSRREVGYLPESPSFYSHLTGSELVRFYARMCGMREPEWRHRVAEVLARVGLTGAADRRVGTYSRGMLQRIGLAQALVHEPRLLILDEPTAGVDPVGAAEIAELLLQLKAAGKTILITSHVLGQMEEICDRVAILHHGRLVAEGKIKELCGRREQQTLVVDALPAEEMSELRGWLAARGRTLESVGAPRVTLERVFLERVGKGSGSSSRVERPAMEKTD